MLSLSRSLRVKTWSNLSKAIVEQFDGVGPTISAKLIAAGFSTVDSIKAVNTPRLELVCGRSAPFGSQLKQAAQRLPTLDVSGLKLLKNDMAEKTVEVGLSVYINAPAGRDQHDHEFLLAVGPDGTRTSKRCIY